MFSLGRQAVGRDNQPAKAISIVPRDPTNLPDRHSGEGRNPEGWGEGNVVRGLVPRWGGGGAWQNPRCQFAVPSHNSSSSYLGVPTPTGMSDCYENRFPPPIRHSGEGRNPEGRGKARPPPTFGDNESQRIKNSCIRDTQEMDWPRIC